MQYRLLRNNKESGPYTKVQLEEIGLKPYDLLWIEGRGGAWLYASEIDDLKSIAPAVEEQPYDRFYKGKEKQSATATASKQNASFTANTTASNTATLKPPKPRFRISGDKVVMIDNAALQEPKPLNDVLPSPAKTQPQATIASKPAAKQEIGAHVQSVGLDWEEAYSDWKVEEKKKEETPTPAKVQTMEEVRQRYKEAKLKQFGEKQNKTAGSARQNIMAAVAIVVLATGGYAGYRLNSSESNRPSQAAPVEKAELVQNENAHSQNATDDVNTDAGNAASQPSAGNQITDNGTAETSSGEIKNSLPANNNNNSTKPQPSVTDAKSANPASQSTGLNNKTTTPENNENNNVLASTLKNEPVKKDKKTAQQELPTNKNQTADDAPNNIATNKDKQADDVQYDIAKTSTTSIPVAPSTETSTIKQPATPSKKIGDYIRVSKLGGSSGSVQNVLLSVKNVADFPIDLAVVDIQYYGANGRYQKGETMYVRNINAGDNVNIRVPDNPASHSITYKISLVSSEQKTLYLVGE